MRRDREGSPLSIGKLGLLRDEKASLGDDEECNLINARARRRRDEIIRLLGFVKLWCTGLGGSRGGQLGSPTVSEPVRS